MTHIFVPLFPLMQLCVVQQIILDNKLLRFVTYGFGRHMRAKFSVCSTALSVLDIKGSILLFPNFWLALSVVESRV